MEKTKVWIVSQTTSSLSGFYEKIAGVFTSENEAGGFVRSIDKKTNILISPTLYPTSYNVSCHEVMSFSDSKMIKKYVDGEIKKTEDAIEKKMKDSEENLAQRIELENRLVELKKFK